MSHSGLMQDDLLAERYRSVLFEVSQAISSNRDLTALFRDLARRMAGLLPFDYISLFLHDADKNVMRVRFRAN